MKIAGAGRADVQVDYADVLRQAVENERWRIIRQITDIVNGEPVERYVSNSSYRTEHILGITVKNNILKHIAAL